MSEHSTTYCLDANVLIQAWQKYYSPALCPDYWTVLDKLGTEKRIFICQEVQKEIIGTEDDLSNAVFLLKIDVITTANLFISIFIYVLLG